MHFLDDNNIKTVGKKLRVSDSLVLDNGKSDIANLEVAKHDATSLLGLSKSLRNKEKSISKRRELGDYVGRFRFKLRRAKIALYNRRLDSVQRRLKVRLDSIGRIKMPSVNVKGSIDSLTRKLDSLRNAGPVGSIRKAKARYSALQGGINKKLSGIEGSVNAKLGLFNKAGGNAGVVNLDALKGKLPHVGSGLNIPSTTLNTKFNTTGFTTNLPKSPGLYLPGGNTPNIPSVNTPSLGGLPNLNGSSIIPKDQLSAINNIKSEAGQINKLSGQVGQYEKDATNLVKGDMKELNALPKDIENKAAGLAEVKSLQKEVLSAEQYKAMVEKWNSDPEYRQEMMVNKAKEQVVNHFAAHQQELNAMTSQLSSAKAKLKDAEEIANLFGKHTNPMKGKPLIERLRPGFNLQFQMNKDLLLDVNPQVGYRFSGRWMAGLGWNYRWGYNTRQQNFPSQDRVFGPRAFVQLKIKDSNYVMAVIEDMNAYVQPYILTSGESATRKWVWSYMAGYKKEFRYSNKLLGSVQILYNLYNPRNQSPYVDRLSLRMGFEFPLKKKIHQ